ncbi:MAG: YkgJ family cysteine cluster protein [Candidatus Omnitrophica bacterium]|nr:YkgJ family cysteine cluster protein [Candidatus Omnitrophota bacterium]
MIKQFIAQDFCLKCLGCCRFREPDSCWSPRFLKEEAGELASRNLLNKEQASSDKVPLRLGSEVDKNFLCLFLNPSSNRCQIYSSRPFECQLYPFLINRKGEKIILSVDLNCPFVKERRSTLEFREYAAYLSELLNSPHYQKLLLDNPQIVQKYDGVLELSQLGIIL